MVSIKKRLAIVLVTLTLGVAGSASASDRSHEARYSSHPNSIQVDHRHHADRHLRRGHPRYRHPGWRKKPHYYSDHRRYGSHHRWNRRHDSQRRYYRHRDVW
ncbi:MAG: hypothetical protein ACTH1W_07670 [Advenella sp.]|uniref:hypothetical protein n=1 Tax=Advenella sp. S44 TaxID=1982755 RepID=UPI00128FDB02|nr:hypothetical protein [Advenella sp. S44]